MTATQAARATKVAEFASAYARVITEYVDQGAFRMADESDADAANTLAEISSIMRELQKFARGVNPDADDDANAFIASTRRERAERKAPASASATPTIGARKWYVATLAICVVVDAADAADAERRGRAALQAIADRERPDKAHLPVGIFTCRPATPDEISLHAAS